MSGHPGHYSLIQYCPDLSRAEAANVGVLLFCPSLGFVDARTSGGNDRVRRFFRGRDLDKARLNMMKRSIERRVRHEASRFRSLDDLQTFIDTRANDIVLTAPRPMRVTDPHADLEQLFAELVGGRSRSEKQKVLIPEMNESFLRLEQQGRLWTKQHVTVPIFGTTLIAPYAYRNGVVNLVKPQAFPPDADETRRRAGTLAIQGDLLKRHPQAGEKYQLVVVSAGREDSLFEREQSIAPLFIEYGVTFVRRAEITEFVKRVESEAHA